MGNPHGLSDLAAWANKEVRFLPWSVPSLSAGLHTVPLLSRRLRRLTPETALPLLKASRMRAVLSLAPAPLAWDPL